jgi:hypothetical protein
MADSQETPKKRPSKPFRGVIDGKSFTKDNQPSPALKKAGWEELRKQRLLTQSVIKEMIGPDGVPTDTFNGYIKALIKNANEGNPKAIDAINKCLEDDIMKIEQHITNQPLLSIDPLSNVDADNNSTS